MTGQRIGYRRVSSTDQNPERQLEGVALDRVFTDKASASDTARPQLKALLDFARGGRYHCRAQHGSPGPQPGRFTQHRAGANCTRGADRVCQRGADLQRRGFPDGASDAECHGSVCGIRARAPQRTAARGDRPGEEAGAYRGRKRTLSPEQIVQLKARVDDGEKKAKIARDLGISRETLYQYLRQASA